MLVLIYKRSGSKLLFPAVYSEKEMDEKTQKQFVEDFIEQAGDKQW